MSHLITHYMRREHLTSNGTRYIPYIRYTQYAGTHVHATPVRSRRTDAAGRIHRPSRGRGSHCLRTRGNAVSTLRPGADAAVITACAVTRICRPIAKDEMNAVVDRSSEHTPSIDRARSCSDCAFRRKERARGSKQSNLDGSCRSRCAGLERERAVGAGVGAPASDTEIPARAIDPHRSARTVSTARAQPLGKAENVDW